MQAEAIREKRARIIKAEAEMEASRKLRDAAEQMANNPVAVELRRMQMVTEVGADDPFGLRHARKELHRIFARARFHRWRTPQTPVMWSIGGDCSARHQAPSSCDPDWPWPRRARPTVLHRLIIGPGSLWRFYVLFAGIRWAGPSAG
jgi:hypothetical protein